MAQNITLLGASYSDVPAVTLPKTGGGTAKFTDVTPTTASASDVASGKIFFDASGNQQTGTSSGGGGGGGVEISQDQDGFIILPKEAGGGGGGGSGWNLLYSDTITLQTASTTETKLTRVSSLPLWDISKLYYFKVRDLAGKRNGYFYGCDEIFMIQSPTAINYGALWTWRTTTSGGTSVQRVISNSSSRSGIYIDYLNTTASGTGGLFDIYYTYNSTYTLTIDGSYSIELYEMELPNG